jgi:hypothetical protein
MQQVIFSGSIVLSVGCRVTISTADAVITFRETIKYWNSAFEDSL